MRKRSWSACAKSSKTTRASNSPDPATGGVLFPAELRLAKLSVTTRQALLTWFRAQARDLPWRRERTPHRVWISEIMLQQTQVATALPYFQRFLEAFPTAAALAEAPEDHVMALWAGLGYYSRARNLMACARKQVAVHGGSLPANAQALAALPGFGPYTVAAVGSLAFGLPLAVLDGNVIRVLARLAALEEDVARPAVRKRLQQMADELLDPVGPGEWNEALMELGATCCHPRQPLCAECPLEPDCLAFKAGTPGAFPVKARKEAPPACPTVVLLAQDAEGRVLARRRGDKGMLRGLWELPSQEGKRGKWTPPALEAVWRELWESVLRQVLGEDCQAQVDAALLDGLRFTHAYSHFRALVLARRVCVRDGAAELHPWIWLSASEVEKLGFSARDRRVLKEYLS
jgi:A/G-specific adenine glycosylase